MSRTAPVASTAVHAPPDVTRSLSGDTDQVLGTSARERLHRARPLVLSLVLLLAVAVLLSWTRPAASSVPLAPDNPGGNGTQALAALLREEGVRVSTAQTLEEAVRASSDEGATVALVSAGSLTQAQRERLAGAGGDVVVVGAIYEDLSGLAPVRSSGVSAPSSSALTARCTDRDALAAGELEGTRGSVRTEGVPDAVGCFPLPEGGGAVAYATAPLASGATLRVLADASALTNARLATAGNAALGVRALGHHEHLVWLDAAHQEPESVWRTTVVPPWAPAVLAQLGVVVLALALVRGRRMGPVVTEDLPVVVRATETTRGRGRLYRRSGDRAHAARALRAGTATRLAHRLGVPTAAGADELVGAVARATGRSEPLVREVLAGASPTDDRALADLADQLDRLESETDRP